MKKQILIVAITMFSLNANAQWAITGNAGTNPTTNFLGTTDAKDLRVRTNNTVRVNITSAGRVGIGTGTAVPAFQFEVKGGSMNVDSMYRIFGKPAVFIQPSQSNYFLFRGMDSVTTGNSNVVIGSTAGTSIKTGSTNTFVGLGAGYLCTSGGSNVAMGFQAGVDITTGNDNVCIGRFAANQITTGINNVMLGSLSLGSSNTSNSVAIGYNSSVATTNSVAIGSGAVSNANNKVRLGSTAITVVEGQVAYSFPSDGRFKINVTENIPGMNFINKLRPVTYNFEAQKFDEFLHHNDKGYATNSNDYHDAEKIIQSGFIAQEVEQAAKELSYNFNGVNAPAHEYDNYSMSYELLVVPMVKGMQELDAVNNKLKSENEELKNRLDKIEALLSISNTKSTTNFQKVVLDATGKTAMLDQNIPNPFNGKTIIRYYITEEIKSAVLIIATSNGVQLNKTTIETRGQGSIEIDATKLSNGNYLYSLITDGVTVDSKQFVLTK